jgi:hypothetical protein
MTCFQLTNVAGPCAVCREYVSGMHVMSGGEQIELRCVRCCPIHAPQEHLTGEVDTIRGEQLQLA